MKQLKNLNRILIMTYNYCYEGLNYEGLTYYESINEYIKMTFFMISFLPFVSIFSTWIVARFIWLPYVKKVRNTKYVIEFNIIKIIVK